MRCRRTGVRHAIPVACALLLALSPGARVACAARPAPAPVDTAERVRTLLRWARESQAEESVESRQRAMRDLDQALQLQPANSEIWLERGRVYERGALETEARDCFSKAIALAPRDPEPCVCLGMAWKRLWLRRIDGAALDSAISCLRRATELRPFDSRTWLRLVPLLVERSNPAGAAFAAERALARRPMYGDGWLARAYLAYRRGEIETADSMFAVALPLLSREERARFADLGPITGAEESERLASAGDDSLRRFWQRLDPDPTSRENELKLEYWSRVAHAILLFEDPLHPEWDARADTYLRYGAPRGKRQNPAGLPTYFQFNALHPIPTSRITGDYGLSDDRYPLINQAWDYPDLGMRVVVQDRSLTGRYEPPVTRDFDRLSAPDPRVLARRRDLVALGGGLAVFPTLAPPAQRIELRGTLVRFEGARGPRLFVQVQAPAAPADTLWARCAVLDARGREVSRDAGALGLSLCHPAERRIAEFSAELPAGAYDVTVSVRDPRHKRGLYRITTELAPSTPGLDLSDIVLTCGTPEVLVSGGSVRLESNPEARVAAGAPLVVYFEIYRLAPGADGLARFEYEYTVRRVIESRGGKSKAAAQASLASTAATR
ncbi:MAG TPA: tetratricopeptide repeat protein, partial [Terriglobales bacterium]|nr:tetratricopeptide repeat protein [Terriglobales bacterium]